MTVGRDDPEIRRAEADIARARDAVAAKVLALQHELARAFDWRAWVAARPYSAIGAALLVGAMIGRWQGPLFHRHR
jgi:hypothetical protein